MKDVLILREPDKQVQAQAKRHRLEVVIAEGSLAETEFDRALIVAPGTVIPWDLLRHGFHFLQRWDAAAPLWRYGKVAADMGAPAEQKRTQKVTRDLRVLLYAHELLFVRDSPDGRALLATWEQEMVGGGPSARLAFLRAVYRVKPLFLTLPRTWSSEVQRRPKERPVRRHGRRSNLVRVEIAPGRYVRCKPGDEEKTLKQWRKQLRRGGRQ